MEMVKIAGAGVLMLGIAILWLLWVVYWVKGAIKEARNRNWLWCGYAVAMVLVTIGVTAIAIGSIP